MKTTSRDLESETTRPSWNHPYLSTSFGETSYPNVECPVTTTFGKAVSGKGSLTVKNLCFISRLNLLG